jgi:uncharacterized membrane protein YgcG
MRGIDFSSWQAVLTTLAGIALFALVGIGIRMLVMFTVQQRRERLNRQINERLKTLIAAYKVLGGSFTGNLVVDPAHLRDLHKAGDEAEAPEPADPEDPPGSDRRRRIRDAVEAALADIILLGTEEQVRLAGQAASELAAGRPVHVHDLVVSLRSFVREALDLAPVPADLAIPHQGPTRPSSSGGGGKGGGRGGGDAGGGGRGGGGGGGGMGGGGGGMGAGMGMGLGGSLSTDDTPPTGGRT